MTNPGFGLGVKEEEEEEEEDDWEEKWARCFKVTKSSSPTAMDDG